MFKLITFIKSLFAPMTVAGVMSDFDNKLKQLETVAKQQRETQAKHALKVQKALAQQSKAEAEEANARHTMAAIKTLLKAPQPSTLGDLKQEIK